MKILFLFLSAFLIISCNKLAEKEAVSAIAENTSSVEMPIFDSVGLQFIAFKTPKKIGVPGYFKELVLNSKPGASLKENLEGATFEIDTKTVETNVEARNAKIVKYFFGMLSEEAITGKYQNFTEEGFELLIKMNGIEKVYKVNNPIVENVLKFDLTIDVLSDFQAASSLNGINKACYELHEGKTWSDVNLEGYIGLAK